MKLMNSEAQMQLWECYKNEDAANIAAEKAYKQMKENPDDPFK